MYDDIFENAFFFGFDREYWYRVVMVAMFKKKEEIHENALVFILV